MTTEPTPEWALSIPPGPWGLYDTVDNCWMGDDKGPWLFEEGADAIESYGLARVASQMVDVQLGQEPGRTRVLTYDGLPKRLRDHVDVKVTAEDALKGMEEGRYI